MRPIDWIITVAPLIAVVAAGLYCRQYVRSVVDFLSAGRMAGRYLLAIAGGELQAGAVMFVALFEGCRAIRLHAHLVAVAYSPCACHFGHHRICRLPLSRNARADAGPIF